MSNKKKTVFNNNWLEEAEFKNWLVPSNNVNQARCKLCHKDFDLSNMGRQAVISHASGKKHALHNVKIQTFFKAPASKVTKTCQETPISTVDLASSSSSPSTSSSKIQSSLKLMVTNAEKTKAEIMWVIKSVCAGFSNYSSNDITPLFRCMFPDIAIAQSFQLSSDKLRYLQNFGIAPYFKSLLEEKLEQSECHVVSFDESLNGMTQTCQMDVLLRYFDNVDNQVKVCFYDSQFLGHSTHKDLQQNFTKALENLNEDKLFQISIDGPNVNLKFLEEMKEKRVQNEQHQLIDIGSCGLHTIHGAFKSGAEKTNWNIKKTLKAAFQMFHDSPARREDFINQTECEVFPLYFCATRWVEDKAVADRLVEIWPSIKKIDNFWQKLSKSKQPKSKSYINFHAAVEEKFTPARLNFFSHVAALFQPFLLRYQTDQPMIPFLYNDLLTLMKKVMLIVIKPDLVHGCSSVTTLKKIDLDDKSNFLKVNNINIGFAAHENIADLKKIDAVSSKQIAEFMNDVITFIVSLLRKLFERSPIKSTVVACANIFDPSVLAMEEIEVLQRLLRHLLKLKILSATMSDKAFDEFSEFIQEVRRIHVEEYKHYNRQRERLDTFYFKPEFSIKTHKELCFVVKIIFTLSHGQASVERGFSVNKSLLKVNISEKSIVAKKIIRDHMLANGLEAHTLEISNKLILSCNTAYSKYKASLEEKANVNKKQQIAKERSVIVENMRSIQQKRDALKRTCVSLENEFIQLFQRAEVESNLRHVVKGNALKRKCDEKKEEIDSLEAELEQLQSKHKKLE